jgi:predicted GIY-YIG superfamily endonuclease
LERSRATLIEKCRGVVSSHNNGGRQSRQNEIGFLFMSFFYVYILTDVTTQTHHYVGYTTDLKERLARHNRGAVPHTAPLKPWKIQTAIAFDCEEKARAFETYLKSHSGRAFAKKHF